MNLVMRRAAIATIVTAAGFWPSRADAFLFGLCRAKYREKAVPTAYYQAPCNACAVQAVPAAPVAVTAAAAPAPAPACTTCAATPAAIAVPQTCMQQRCYMAPVTTMQTQTVQEPVTTYQTSYSLEPVVSHRTSAYYDPCTCSYYNVTTPVTSYVRKAHVTPVTTMVTRHYQVPVTTYEKRCVTEPVTRIQYYVPATAPAAVAAVPAVPAAPAVAAVPAVPAAPAGVAMAPAPAGQVQQYWNPTAPQQQQQPQPQQQQQNVIERQYQDPNVNGAQGTLLIEKTVRDGKVIKETREYIAPNQPVPPPKMDGTPSNSAYTPGQPRLLKPVPSLKTASASAFYR